MCNVGASYICSASSFFLRRQEKISSSYNSAETRKVEGTNLGLLTHEIDVLCRHGHDSRSPVAFTFKSDKYKIWNVLLLNYF